MFCSLAMPLCRDSALSMFKFLELGGGGDCGGERSRRRMKRRESPAVAAAAITVISSHVSIIWNCGFDFVFHNLGLFKR